MPITLRNATLDDVPELDALIARSARELSSGEYRPEQVEGALKGAFGVDSQLIKDGTYFAVQEHNRIVGCGGWSYRTTLFGSDARSDRDASTLDPATQPAKIRAFFVDPEFARRGIGTMLLGHCEAEAQRHGYGSLEMMATLPGVKLYGARGYIKRELVRFEVAAGVFIEFIPMFKTLLAP